MPTLTIQLSDEQAEQLQVLAEKLRVDPDALLQASVDDLLGRAHEDFLLIIEYILEKNAELYRRLA
jgi:predicted transcriptional regulator